MKQNSVGVSFRNSVGVSFINIIKESVYVFIDSKLYGKVAFLWQTPKYKKAIWCWYIEMAYQSDFNFGM